MKHVREGVQPSACLVTQCVGSATVVECALPAFSRRIPPIPVCLPGDSRVPMLQLSLSPSEGVRIHLVLWACVEAARQERQV